MAITGSTLQAIDYVVKNTFVNPTEIWDTASREHIFMMMLTKRGGFTGSEMWHPVRTGNAQGISNTFSDAQGNATSHKGVRWELTRAKKYGYHEIDGETMHAAVATEGAFFNETTLAVNSLLASWGDDAAKELYLDGNGSIGVISGTPASNVITLATADDAQNFELGMSLEIWDALTGGSEITTGTFVVTAVNEDAGTITVTDDGSAADTNFIFREGNRGNGVKGLDAWLPETAPTSGDSFFSVDRSVHPTRLAGHRVDATGTDLDEALLDLASKIHRKKGRINKVFMNTTNWTNVQTKLGLRIERSDTGGAQFGYEFLRMGTPAGVAELIADPDCPPDKAYALDMRTWVLKHLKELPHIVDDDGRTMARITDEDGVELRARGFWQLVCGAPGFNGVVHNIGS